MSDNLTEEVRAGDIVNVYDMRDGALIDTAIVKEITQENTPGISSRRIANLNIGYAVSVKCLRKIWPHQ